MDMFEYHGIDILNTSAYICYNIYVSSTVEGVTNEKNYGLST